jgi:polyphosphate:AMP phosphotransferase
MFEAAEVGRKLSKEAHGREVPKLRESLLETQRALREAAVPTILVVGGVDGAGKGETVNRLHEWLDPRGLETHVFDLPSSEERERPSWWRFWRTLPGRGRIGIFFGSWYTEPIIRRVYGKLSSAELDEELARVAFFERMLAEDGALIVKVWLHLSKKEQRRKLRRLEKNKETRWRVSPLDWKHFSLYDRFRKVSEQALRRTDIGQAPWTIVEAADDRYREVMVARALVEAAKRRLAAGAPPRSRATPAPTRPPEEKAAAVLVLDKVDLAGKISDKDYDKQFVKLQAKAARLSREAFTKKLATVAVFEGWDAAGKGGAIRRVTGAIDARLYRVVPIAAPTEEERAQHYLWRFWRHLPADGRITIFDRSWYGRVLVERVEGFAREEEWRRAYLEINEFEDQLTRHGAVVMKFWLHVSPEEQLRRFKDREKTAYKRHKITDEDWRNRKRWDAYAQAIDEMVARCSTPRAPWTLIPANDKKLARIRVLEEFVTRWEKAL